MIGGFIGFLNGLNMVVLVYFLILNTCYAVLAFFAFVHLAKHRRRLDAEDPVGVVPKTAPPIALIAPCYNEEATCVESTRSLLTVSYPSVEIILVNDGSKDNTVGVLIDAFDFVPVPREATGTIPTQRIRQVYRSTLQPDLWLIDKENGGKADALNTGVNHCRSPLFCAMDADTLLDPDALSRVARPYLEDRNTVATGGVIRIVNDCKVEASRVRDIRLPKARLARVQVLEYLRAFLIGRIGWDVIEATLIISGAFGLFHRGAVVEVGGYDHGTVGEDMELIIRLHRYMRENKRPYRIRFVADPIAWTEAPDTAAVLGRQRNRWQRGLADCLWIHRKMLFNPTYGAVGMIAFPYFVFIELIGPIVELVGYAGFLVSLILGIVSGPHMAAFFSVAVIMGAALSIATIALSELALHRYWRTSDYLRLFGLCIVEAIGFRQMSVWWRFKGLHAWLKGDKGWGKMQRKGFSTPKA